MRKKFIISLLICILSDYIIINKIHATSCTLLTIKYYILCKDGQCIEGFEVNEIRTGKICGRRPVVNKLPLWVLEVASDLLKAINDDSSSGIFQIIIKRHYFEEMLYNRTDTPQSYEDFIERLVEKLPICDDLPESIVCYKKTDMQKKEISPLLLYDISQLYHKYYNRPIINKISDKADRCYIKSLKNKWVNNELKSLNKLKIYNFANRLTFVTALILVIISLLLYRKKLLGNNLKRIKKLRMIDLISIQILLFSISIIVTFRPLSEKWLFVFIWPIITIIWFYEISMYIFLLRKKRNKRITRR